MKKPITVTVSREHGNSGDVILAIKGADGETKSLATPGDCSPYAALATIKAFLEDVLNGPVKAPAPIDTETAS